MRGAARNDGFASPRVDGRAGVARVCHHRPAGTTANHKLGLFQYPRSDDAKIATEREPATRSGYRASRRAGPRPAPPFSVSQTGLLYFHARRRIIPVVVVSSVAPR
jgi:hypothetical protein